MIAVYCLSSSSTCKDLGADLVKPYKVNDIPVNQSIELKHGKSTKTWTMDKISNAPWEAVSNVHFFPVPMT